jgi:hypothetical protein
MSRRAVLLALLSLLLGSSAAPGRAAFISHTASVALQNTDFNSSVSIPKFDTIGGVLTLTQIEFTLTGHVEGNTRFESLDASPTTVTTNKFATITLRRPDNSSLVAALPSVATSDNLTAFDGVTNFGGGSGRSYLNQSADNTQVASIFPPLSPADLSNFIGSGSIVLPVTAVGATNDAGSNNLLRSYTTRASATITVTYHFIPEPPSGLLVAMGAAAAAFLRGRIVRRRGEAAPGPELGD